MPNPILLNIKSATSSNMGHAQAGIDLAVARGFAGVRISAGMDANGDQSTVNTFHVSTIVAYGAAAGLTKMSFLLNGNPKREGAYLKPFNGEAGWAVQSRPPAGTGNAIWNYIADGWIAFITAARTAAISAGKTPSTFLEFEGFNEPGKGGNQAPTDNNDAYTAPYDTYNYGYIEPAFWTMAAYIGARAQTGTAGNFYGIPFIPITLEADESPRVSSGTIDAQVEVDSFAGANCVSYMALGTKVGFNRYANGPTTPYNAAMTKAAYSTKVQQQVTRMGLNAILTGKAYVIREFGLDVLLSPSCTHCNTVRDDLLEQLKGEANIAEAGFFCAFDVALVHDYLHSGEAKMFAYERADSSPLGGIAVAP
ncbi:MAG: hypothetical protein QOJ65_1441 [Fimbriimonadaceae bacterium]|jgi:hypothetical protein|nr:hypothetical protein [Fimbriimonadaceae bacterium]